MSNESSGSAPYTFRYLEPVPGMLIESYNLVFWGSLSAKYMPTGHTQHSSNAQIQCSSYVLGFNMLKPSVYENVLGHFLAIAWTVYRYIKNAEVVIGLHCFAVLQM